MRRVVGWTDGETTHCRACTMTHRPYAEDGAEAIRYGDPDAREVCVGCAKTLQEIAWREDDGYDPSDDELGWGDVEFPFAKNH